MCEQECELRNIEESVPALKNRDPVPIVKFGKCEEELEACLESVRWADGHRAPWGKTKKHEYAAEKHLRDVWGYALSGRRLILRTNAYLEEVEKQEKRLDAESGQEYDRSDIKVRSITMY
jgi:hypothetical protein